MTSTPTSAHAAADILQDIREGVMALTLNRPARRNAMSAAMLTTVRDAARQADEDPAVRVIVLRSSLSGKFCAGADIGTLSNPDPAALEHHFSLLTGCVDALRTTSVPVLTAVDGDCLGAGCALAAASDIVLARADVRFSLPEVQLGIAPVLAMMALAPVVSLRDLVLWSATGGWFSADEARQGGLVSRVIPAESFEAQVKQVLDGLARSPRSAQRHLKRAARILGTEQSASLRDQLMPEMLATATHPEAQAAIRRFLDRKN